ncbi:amino acid ABC transporter permease [Phytomonospora endophytica]|uniref:Glutamate transport system permease protein n=1 Tax=Phytomonospora endophytica TaxID=714109 RepID=A0A841G5T5_9ACTN|nr:amino acid ABC transporter permease [Phytomonospora endophytica]MBB6039450.1 glutamate transport system permease protein [Phytomonospora endophytica]GIG70177.1 glutamate ABC transporter permease [Phytomonospora endophytica]
MSNPSKSSSVLFDALGPRGRSRVLLFSALSAVVVLGILAYAYFQLNSKHFFDSSRWVDALDALVIENTYIPGLLNTLKAAGLASIGALVLGSFIGFGRISRFKAIRFLSGVYVQFFRAIPVLLLIWIPYTISNHTGTAIDGFYFVVVGLSIYNGAVLAEILRSGINALPSGQAAAGHAIGLRHGQVLRLIVFPQAFRNMLPAVLAQLVVLLKDTALGYIVTYPELLKMSQQTASYYTQSFLQVLVVAAIVYFVIAYALSKLVSFIEVRMRRKVPKAATTAAVAPAPEPV